MGISQGEAKSHHLKQAITDHSRRTAAGKTCCRTTFNPKRRFGIEVGFYFILVWAIFFGPKPQRGGPKMQVDAEILKVSC